MTRTIPFLLFGLLTGCASEWRTSEPVTPSTYQAPSYRSASSIGKLSRLAVMPVDLHMEADDTERAKPEWMARHKLLAHELQAALTAYLSQKKGYTVQTVDSPPLPMEPAAIRAMGQRLDVDGIVMVERWIKPPWSTAKGILNVFLLNIPLFQALSELNLRISIYEASSGRLVWQQEMKGQMSEAEARLDPAKEMARALGDLENAVPAQLRR